jgi:hypothetical protein
MNKRGVQMTKKIPEEILNLLETMEEGIEYSKKKVSHSHMGDAIKVLLDTMEAFFTIEQLSNSYFEDSANKELSKKEENIKKAFELITRDFENTGGKKVFEIIQFNLEPTFKSWKEYWETNGLKVEI